MLFSPQSPAVRLGALVFIHPATLRMAAHVPRFHLHSIAASLPVPSPL